MKYVAMTATLMGLLLGTMGCADKKAEAPEEAPAAAPEAAPEPGAEKESPAEVAEPEKPRLTKAAKRRLRLEASFAALYCAQKGNATGDRLGLYKEHGFDSPAAWSKSWHSAARSDVDWANQVVSTTLASDCKATP